jgi:uncharacterized protein (TIGR01244 family)
MQKTIKMNDQITVGGQPTSTELQQLAEQGFKTIINLRTSNEENQPLKPDEEGRVVEQLGMQYLHIPVSRENMDEAQVSQFRDQLARLPSPQFVHCGTGRRAGALTMMQMAIEQGMTGGQALEKAEQMGFECDHPQLKDFVNSYIDRNTRKQTASSST